MPGHACIAGGCRNQRGEGRSTHTDAMLTQEDQQDTMARLLPFQQQMVEELLADDGLCIMSAGMGWQTVSIGLGWPLFNHLLCCASLAAATRAPCNCTQRLACAQLVSTSARHCVAAAQRKLHRACHGHASILQPMRVHAKA